MNREKLKALLKMGLITEKQYLTAEKRLPAADFTLPVLTLHLDLPLVTLDASETETSGGVLTAQTVTRYEELIESHGMIIHAGALSPREPLERNKLLRDHDSTQPIGYMLSVTDDRLGASWQVASTEIDRVKQEFDEHLRDGLSVGFSVSEYEIDDDWTMHIYAADWYETSVCAIPAVAEAGITDVAASLAVNQKGEITVNRAQLAAALKAGRITQEQHDQAVALLDVVTTPPAGEVTPPPATLAQAAGPELQTEQPAPIHTSPRRKSLSQITTDLAAAFSTGNTHQVHLAIADIIPADDAAPAWLRDDWEGELFRAVTDTRPWIDAIGIPGALTNLTTKGWKWATADENGDGGEPLVAEYSGDKTEVASNEIGTTAATFTAFRIAAGWDVDRAFTDFADTEFQRSFWEAVMRDYKKKSNAGIRTRTLTAATAPGAITAAAGGTATVSTGGVKALLKQVVKDVRAVGGRVNRIFLGDDKFGELEDLDTDTLPLWLKSATIGLDIAEGSADIGTLRILNDSALNDNQAVAFDSRALLVKEKSPLQVSAIDVSKGGIDLGFYGYLRLDPHDPRCIVKRTYAEVLPT